MTAWNSIRFGVAFALLCQAAFSQTITGAITGTVTDPTGAVVPNVTVRATNTGTNRGHELGLDPLATGFTTNDQEHAFLISNVPEPGTLALAFCGIAGFAFRRWYKS